MKIKKLFDKGSLENTKEVILFGIGEVAEEIRHYIESKNIQVLFYCDNDSSLHNNLYRELEVLSPIVITAFKDVPVVITSSFFSEIVLQLHTYGSKTVFCSKFDVKFDYDNFRLEASQQLTKFAVVLPTDKKKFSEISRQLKHIEEYFYPINNIDYYSSLDNYEYYAKYFALLTIYSEQIVSRDYDTLIFIGNTDNQTHIESNLRYILNPIVFTMMGVGGIELRCLNRTRQMLPLYEKNEHIFKKYSSENSRNHYYFFPFAVLHRDNSVGSVNEFGFRIPKNYQLLINREKDHKLVCVFGGSTVYSIGCLVDETFSAILENKLNRHYQQLNNNNKVTVLNFGQPGCTLINEIIFYLIFAYELKPDIVIAHDGGNDLGWGQESDSFILKKLKLIYPKPFEEWSKILHKTYHIEDASKTENNPQLIAKAYFNRKLQFKSLVEGNNGIFIWGIQPLINSKAQLTNIEKEIIDNERENIDKILFLYKILSQLQIKSNIKVINIQDYLMKIQDNDPWFLDSAHATPKLDNFIAQAYMDLFFINEF